MSHVLAILPIFVGLYFCVTGCRAIYCFLAEPRKPNRTIAVLQILLGIGLILAPFAR